jgi:hypothetical protein
MLGRSLKSKVIGLPVSSVHSGINWVHKSLTCRSGGFHCFPGVHISFHRVIAEAVWYQGRSEDNPNSDDEGPGQRTDRVSAGILNWTVSTFLWTLVGLESGMRSSVLWNWQNYSHVDSKHAFIINPSQIPDPASLNSSLRALFPSQRFLRSRHKSKVWPRKCDFWVGRQD